MNQDDHELARRVAKGDRNASESLVAVQYEPILRFLTLLTHNEDLARDLAQDTFVRARLKAGSYRGDSPIRLWLQGIAWREFLKSRRKRRPDSPFEPEHDQAEAEARLSVDALDLWDAIGQLSEPLRAAFVLHEVTGWTTCETAKILGVPEGTVTARLSRARQRLREFLKEDDGAAEGNESLKLGT